ncbi:FAD binding domain-containing protein [Penicillium riverlandense]|uniref:FAD binding domain-containing protein n=1 Tax=Penicillium riverlandense TaxID=1903569 RepID=UPI0025495518|nr:FAD binding domain-containing protein [Penicillium riverlandense]KAJ5812014.1 FAD binding domain-containing protein [Penicillium riverlandense]
MTEQVDVLICGSGSAGLCAAVWLARCGVSYKILERRPGPLDKGQADGVQCRTVEIFESLGISEDLLKEAHHILELAVWSPDGEGGIKWSQYSADTEPGLSHQPHVILNQARVNELMMGDIQRSAGRIESEYGVEVTGVHVNSEEAKNPDAFCVETTAISSGKERKYLSKYVLSKGCDGAHSAVRKSLGFQMLGDSTNTLWGVIDLYPRTDFPDLRKKVILHSDAGQLGIIPREGDSMVRFYIELDGMAAQDVTLATLEKKARAIFRPYSLEITEVVWWSAYSIGQRLAEYFTQDNRVFLTGDACHTHSPKAGQGMNVSLQDGYNIGWKLAAVLRGQCPPEILETYVSERQKTASDLINFDRSWSKLFSTTYCQENNITPEYIKEQFVKSGRYTAGLATKYERSLLVSPNTDTQDLATHLVVGTRFPSAQVVRLCDAKAMQLVRALPADSRWHMVVFAGDIADQAAAERLQKLSTELNHIIRRFTPQDQDVDSKIQSLLVVSTPRVKLEQKKIPELFTPVAGKWRMKCLQKVFVDDESYTSGHGHAYETYGIGRTGGCLVIVRPDQYIARLSSLEDWAGVARFFEGFMLPVAHN